MKAYEIKELGVPFGAAFEQAQALVKSHFKQEGATLDGIKLDLAKVVAAPEKFTGDDRLGAYAQAIIDTPTNTFTPREEPAPWRQWGTGLEESAVDQMRHACDIPVAVAGALMPDAHLGYGLPIGGVLATEGAVIPYAVGVDIACRMKLSVYDLPTSLLEDDPTRLKSALARETQFGIGAKFKNRREHDVLDMDWSVSKVTKDNKDRAWAQLGTSGSGNHFVEFGLLTLEQPDLGLEAGTYLSLLSHSGSRGTGAAVAAEYSKRAMSTHPDLPRELIHLAWLDLDHEDGKEYWDAMSLMGEYAKGNHACIHRHVAANLGAEIIADVENHHNFAWKEHHFGKDVIVHRKGATPAGEGVIGIIPGSMATPGYVVRGKGQPDSMNSAAHGAGRVMSRTKAKKTFVWQAEKEKLNAAGITLLSAGLDEVPGVYKDIETVMAAQSDLVEIVARFDPKIVKMADGKCRPED